MKKKIAFAILVILLAVGVYFWHDNFTVEPPQYPPLGKVVWLDQNWTAEQRDWFHHADQGTQTFGIPYEWFMALEQPPISSTGSGLLSDPTYLDRYGFIPDTAHPEKSVMPIGFAPGWIHARRQRHSVEKSANKCGHDRDGLDLRRVPYRSLHL